MGRIVVTEFISVDGVIEDPGGAEDYEHSGWSFEFDRGDDGNKFKLDETMESEALLLGRVTFQGFADAWPSREGEFADKFNDMPKYVVSSTIDGSEWNNSTVLEHGLVDELRLMVFPVVLGSGKRLFGDGGDKRDLQLTDSRTVGDGVGILVYRPAT